MEQSLETTPAAVARPRIVMVLIWLISYAVVVLAYGLWFSAPLWISLPLVWIVPPLSYYVATPIAASFRLWSYLSGYFLLYRATPKAPYALHLGTSYDAIWRLRPCRRPGERLAVTMQRELYSGLRHFCELVREGKIPGEAVVEAGSYFLTPKQMARYGFREARVTGMQRLTFLLGYPEILLQQLLITGRLRFYNPFRIRSYRSTAAEIAQREEYFTRLAVRSVRDDGE